jgi:hypothetical protein
VAATFSRWLALPSEMAGGSLTPLPPALEAAFATDISSVLAPKAQVWLQSSTTNRVVPTQLYMGHVYGAIAIRISTYPHPGKQCTHGARKILQKSADAQGFMAQLQDPKSPPPIGSPVVSAADQLHLDIGLAAAAASACGIYFQLLRGSSFSRRIGQPLLTVLEKVLTANSTCCTSLQPTYKVIHIV